MKIHNLKKRWAAGISDGLTLTCLYCKRIPEFDYHISDKFWNSLVPKRYRLGVVCLPCLDKIASKKGKDISKYLEEVQFTGFKKTIILRPSEVYHYPLWRYKRPSK